MKLINPKLTNKMDDVTVMLTTGCTMSCAYCFEHQRDHSKDTMMKPETLISILERHIAHGNRFDLHLFGGEPSLNKACLQALVNYLSTHKDLPTHFFIDIQTNAYKLDNELIELFKELSILSPCGFGICVSLDSVVPEGNAYRVDHDKEYTWYTVYNNILKLRQLVPGAYIDIHSVISNKSAPFFAETVTKLKNLADEGLIDNFGMNWIDPDTVGFELSEEAIDTVLYQYWTIIYPEIRSKKWSEESVSGFMVMGLDDYISLEDSEEDKQYNICGAGSKLIAYMPDGNMVPCHKFIDKRAENLELDISDFPPKKEYIKGEFNYFCIDCPLKHNCQTCIASNILYGGHVYKQSDSVCRRKRMIYKKMMEWKLRKQQQLLDEIINDNKLLSEEIRNLTIEIGESLVG